MIRKSLALIVLLAALPAAAQDAAPAPETPPSTEKPDLREGFDLMEEGGKLILRHLFEEMEPALRDIEGALKEAFASGTAAVISPMGLLRYQGKEYTIHNREVGALSQKIYDTITGIQTGKIADTRGWIQRVI